MTIFEDLTLVDLSGPRVREGMDIAVDGGVIADVGKSLAAKYPSAAREHHGNMATPGLVCSHHHLYSALARGMMVAIQPSKDFAQQLKHLWWRLDRAIDEKIIRASVLAGLCEAARWGVTSVIDHHASPEFIDGSLSAIREEFERMGMRGVLCYETTERNFSGEGAAGVEENVRFAKEVDARRSSGPNLVEAMIGGHAPFTLPDGALRAMGDAVKATGRGAHIHVAEDRYDAVDSRHRFGLDPAARLDQAGLLGPRTIIGHGVHLGPDEAALLNERGCFLAHNARSNVNNSVGYNKNLHLYKNVVLGTDGIGADMIEEFKFAYFRHREEKGPWWGKEFLAALDRGNRVLEAAFQAGGDKPRFGSLEPGMPADIAFWDYDPPTPLLPENVDGHFAFGFSSRSARSTMVAGRFVMKDRTLAVDEGSILEGARDQALRLWKRMEERK
jgi:putative selenium metabolism protein SsnA